MAKEKKDMPRADVGKEGDMGGPSDVGKTGGELGKPVEKKEWEKKEWEEEGEKKP